VGKVDAERASPKVWFTGGNVLICLKYLYNKTCELRGRLNAPQGQLTQFVFTSSLDPSLP
jgi:hypothetical protein